MAKLSKEDLAISLANIGAWKNIFVSNEAIKAEFIRIYSFLITLDKESITPKSELIFDAFVQTQPENVRVILIGQDPYPKLEHASGLAFSVANGSMPGSLHNISKALVNCGYPALTNGDISGWAVQGVLMLNSRLTCPFDKTKAANHKVWHNFIILIMQYILTINPNVLFIAWGKDAQDIIKSLVIPNSNIFAWRHPSPMANTNHNLIDHFPKCPHFKQINDRLLELNAGPAICWSVYVSLATVVAEKQANNYSLITNRIAQLTNNNISYQIAYTDGACSGLGTDNCIVSWAFAIGDEAYNGLVPISVIESNNTPLKTIILPTNQRGELMAIMKLLEYTIESNISNNTTLILITDSEYGKKTYTEYYADWLKHPTKMATKLNLDIITPTQNIIDKLRAERDIAVEFFHIRGHQPEPEDKYKFIWFGNDKVDALAKSKLKE